jgi:spermidine synthase
LEDRAIETRWVVASFLDYLVTTDRATQARRLLEADGEARLNRDLTPICYYYDLLVWLSLFDQGLVYLASGVSSLSLSWAALPLILVVLMVRFHRPAGYRRWAIPVALGLIGLAQMILEVALLFGFQVAHGQVYGRVGLIVTAFMAGLALGGLAANRWSWPDDAGSHPNPGDDGILWRIRPRCSPRAMLAWIGGTMALIGLALPLVISASPPTWVFGLYALGGGGLTGLAFPVAVACEKRERDGTGRVAGALYGSDLAGGCLGALVASALLLPILGIPQTCIVVALAGAAAVAVVV